MHDALLIYFLIANMRHAGYFRGVANFVRWAKAQYASVMPVIVPNRRASVHEKFRLESPIDLAVPFDLVQCLGRLENYVASMS
jgi:hypothetical protein